MGLFDFLGGLGRGLERVITGPIGQAGFGYLLSRQQRKDELKFAKQAAELGVFAGRSGEEFSFRGPSPAFTGQQFLPPPVVPIRTTPLVVGGGGPLLLGPGPTVPSLDGGRRMAVGQAPFVQQRSIMARTDGFAFPALAEALGLGNGGAAGSLVDCPSAFTMPGGTGVRAKSTIIVPSPDGRLIYYKNMGRPILFSGDLAAAKRVARVARRARRAHPSRHSHRVTHRVGARKR